MKAKFNKKKYRESVRGILGKYLDGTEKEFSKCAEEILALIEAEHIAKEHFREQAVEAVLESCEKQVTK
jgi:hypothetical protein